MRVFFILFWIAAIFVFTCTSSFSNLFLYGVIEFEWVNHPNVSEMLLPLPGDLPRMIILQKFGHIMAFFILTLLLLARFQSIMFILTIAVSYSALTEFLQLYFTRDGRLFDIGFDVVGVLLALCIGRLARINTTRQHEFKN